MGEEDTIFTINAEVEVVMAAQITNHAANAHPTTATSERRACD